MATGKDADYFRKKLGETAPRSVIVGSEDAFFCELDAAGVRTAVAPSGNNLGMTLDALLKIKRFYRTFHHPNLYYF